MGKGVMLRGKEQENIYPVTSSDLVYDPVTKKNVKEELGGKVEEAPSDDKQYARINGTWAEVEAGAVSETALISITPELSELHGVSVKVTTNEGDTVLDTTWQGSMLSCQIRAGLQYTVAVGSKDGFIAPESVTYTAVKGASRTINMAYIESRLTVGILSNQENDATIAAVKATVKYGSTTVQVANGGTVNLPQDVDVTITFPAVEGYKAPDAITYNHTSGSYTKNGTYQCELVRVTLSASNGASVSGQKVTINGVAHTYDSTTVEQKVPFGTTYFVSVDDMDGFTTPASQSFTAAESVRNLSLIYEEAKMGVFIQGISGKLYTKDEWNNQETPNGIAVLTEQCRVVMALDYKEGLIWSSPAISYSDTIFIANNIEEAYLDYNGAKNTDGIINGGSATEAAIYCRDTYTFPNGKKGYLGSVGELNMIIRNNGSVVFGIYAILKGENFPPGMALWTSTLKTGFYPYVLSEGYEFEPFYQDDTFCALPLSQLTTEQDLIQFTILDKTYEAMAGTKWEDWCSSAFNTDGYYIEGTMVNTPNGKYSVETEELVHVSADDVIISGTAYIYG